MVNSFHFKLKVAIVSLLLTGFTLANPINAWAKEFPFRTGEKLTYDASWLFFTAGRLVSYIPGTKRVKGRDLLHFSMHATTTNTVASIWSMDDHFDSYWDRRIEAAQKFTIKIRESTVTKDKEIIFDHKNNAAIVKQNSDKPKKFKLEKGSTDFFTAGHKVRTKPLNIGDKYEIPIFEDNKNYFMHVKVLRKDRIHLMGKTIDTILTRVKIKFEGAFQSRGVLMVWYTDDKHKAPVQIKVSSFFGSVKIYLVDYEGVDLKIK